MSTLPGNPHAELVRANLDAEEVIPLRHDDDESAALRELAQVEATLAVAHELRTANLIAFRQLMGSDAGLETPINQITELEARLGLGGATLGGEGQ